MKAIGDQVAAAVVAVAEEADKEKKKKRRPNRRSKQNLAVLPGGACSSVDGAQASEWFDNGSTGGPKVGLMKASNAAFNSLPAMHINGGDGAPSDFAPSDVRGENISRSCPLPISSSPPNTVRRKYFEPHWSDQDVQEAIEKGYVFRANFRVNAHNRLEAYCSVDGVRVDVLISGVVAQNRAIEGDVVAVMLDPVASWTRLKGSNGHPSNPVLTDHSNMLPEVREVTGYNCLGKDKVDADAEYCIGGNGLIPLDREFQCQENSSFIEAVHCDLGNGLSSSYNRPNGHQPTVLESSNADCFFEQGEAARAIEEICAILSSYPSKRPTGRVISIIEKSRRRGAVIGFLAVKQWLFEGEGYGKGISGHFSKKEKTPISFSAKEYIQLIPTDSKFPKMVVSVISLTEGIKERLNNGDVTVEMELVAARVDDWSEESLFPQAHVVHVLGRGGEIAPQLDAILFENAICIANFSPESLSCLPDVPWNVPTKELKTRKDLRNICTFTIDPFSAIDLDDALSVERVSDEIIRIGVHIADVSYFVLPDTALDTEAQIRSTSVYMLQNKLPMLPQLLSEELGSLIPGVDRLVVSIIWDINRSGKIIDRWIGHSVIRSCCKLSYDFVQDIIDGSLEADRLSVSRSSSPQLFGQFEWKDVISSIRSLHEISKKLGENRFKGGALWLDSAKLGFMFDEYGAPYDIFLYEKKESCYIVEEFMLLANRSVAEVISRVFPDCALLRRHPEPNLRKLKEFEAFCIKHGFNIDTSSSGQLHLSLSKIREKLRNDPVFFDILVSYASRPLQSAMYFCTGELRDRENDWAHYSLAVPFYTHFTSPLRRYPDIIVHRTLSAALDAEEMFLKPRTLLRANKGGASGNEITSRCFTGLYFDKDAAVSPEGREALSAAALKFKVPGTDVLAEVTAYCNERKLASRHAEEAGEKLYLWALLKKKEILICEGRVLGLGPRFMSIYIHKLAIERRIYYDEVEGLIAEWLDTTSTLVLNLLLNKRFQRKGGPGKFRPLEDSALVVNPSEFVVPEEDRASQAVSATSSISTMESEEKKETNPAFFPLTLQHLSAVPVALHAVGGVDGPLDIGARLYMCSYFT